ncbi:MAG: hypothetical protein ACI825_001649 [Planctomycetota bacterium]|jgi:hypothetical protein
MVICYFKNDHYMKYIILFFCSIAVNPVISQDYTPMLAGTNEWHLTYCFEGDCSEDVYYTDGETEMQGNVYKVLDGYHYISREFLLREELEAKQVYLATIFGGVFREYLLYDFSLVIGDEFQMTNPITPFPEDGGIFTLDDIQMIALADGNLYKHYYFSPSLGNTASTWNAIWVEGLGSLSLPNAPGGDPSATSAGRVSCSFRDGAVFYSDFELVEDCSPTVLAIASQNSKRELTVITTQETIIIKSHQAILDYMLFDTSGKVVASNNVNRVYETSLESTSLRKGIYFLKINCDTFRTMEKVFIR